LEKCVNHEERLTSYSCMKHGVYMCEECMHCTDPTIYCKYRQSCPIWYTDKENKPDDKIPDSSPGQPEETGPES
jgi:hypothetical protein